MVLDLLDSYRIFHSDGLSLPPFANEYDRGSVRKRKEEEEQGKLLMMESTQHTTSIALLSTHSLILRFMSFYLPLSFLPSLFIIILFFLSHAQQQPKRSSLLGSGHSLTRNLIPYQTCELDPEQFSLLNREKRGRGGCMNQNFIQDELSSWERNLILSSSRLKIFGLVLSSFRIDSISRILFLFSLSLSPPWGELTQLDPSHFRVLHTLCTLCLFPSFRSPFNNSVLIFLFYPSSPSTSFTFFLLHSLDSTSLNLSSLPWLN